MSYTEIEIESQPEIWRNVIANLEKNWGVLLQEIAGLKFSRIIVTGCGSTYYLAYSAAQALNLFAGVNAQAYPASEAWMVPALFPVEGTLLLAISRSGTTTETLRAVEQFQAQGGATVGIITCYADSPLAALGDIVLSADIARENSVVQTRSFTSMYLLAIGFASLLGKQKDLLTQMKQLPNELAAIMANRDDYPGQWADWERYTKIFFLGNGPNYGLACEAMLKVKEMSLSWVEAYHTLEFRHGPMSLVDHQTLVVGFISDTMRQPELDVLNDLQGLGAAVVVCDTNQDHPMSFTPDFYLQTSLEINEWLRGLLYLPMMQRLGHQRALASHLDPDHPTNLSQVIKFDTVYTAERS